MKTYGSASRLTLISVVWINVKNHYLLPKAKVFNFVELVN